jgi:anti-anti-sigma factor
MILVTVGTEQYPFNSLMSWIDLLIREKLIDQEEEVVVQYGASRNLPDQVRIVKRLPESEFKALLEQARVVISHCGEGSVMLLESLDKPYILVPRIQRFGEHVDNHQIDLAIAMEKQGIPIARSPGDLVRFLADPKAGKSASHDEEKLCKFLSESYNKQYKKIMLVCSSGGHFTYAQSLKPFIEQFQDICWVTFKTATTESQFKADKQRKYWAYSPTNRNLPNFIRNIILAFNVLNKERPDVVVSTGAGVAVPFLILAKFLYRKKTIFIESKTRINKLSLSAKILQAIFALDNLIVRSYDLKNTSPRTEYVDISSAQLVDKSWGNIPNVLKFKDTVFLRTSRHLSNVEVAQFKEEFRDLCNLAPQKIVLDLSPTLFISSSGLGALVNSLKLANALNIKLILWSVNPEVMAVLTMSRLNKAFTIETATSAVRPQNKKIVPSEIEIDLSGTSLSQRAIDIVVSILALSLTAILVIPIGILIKLDCSGSIFCVQSRYGMMGKHFQMRTFRSRSTKNLSKDKLTLRITKIGYFLRKTNLDKLPLFWNVLMGDMSLVGPRASTVDELDCYSTKEWKALQVKPGMISEWKVNYELSERCCQSTASVLD